MNCKGFALPSQLSSHMNPRFLTRIAPESRRAATAAPAPMRRPAGGKREALCREAEQTPATAALALHLKKDGRRTRRAAPWREQPASVTPIKEDFFPRWRLCPLLCRIFVAKERFSSFVGASPSGKAPVFGIGIPRFESWRPSQDFSKNIKKLRICFCKKGPFFMVLYC